MKKLLPFHADSLLKTLQYHAFMAGIITADGSRQKEDWLVSYSLRVINSGNDFFVCYPGDCPTLLHELSGTQEDCFERKSVSLLDLDVDHDVVNLFQDRIKQGYYIYGIYDEFYIPGKTMYQKNNFMHDYLMIGFDDAINSFYIAGYTSKEKYEIMEIKYEDFILGVKNISEGGNKDVDFYRLKPEFPFGFHNKKVKKSLVEFVESKETSFFHLDYCHYGIQALEDFSRYMNADFAKKNLFLYRRNMGSFREHAIFFAKMITYLLEQKYIEHVSPYIEVKDNSISADVLLNLTMKYNITQNIKIPDRIQKIVKEIIQKEICAARSLFEDHRFKSGELFGD